MGKTNRVKSLVLGLGNPILSDDGAGIRVAQYIRQHYHRQGVTMMEASQAGLNLLDLIAGYDKLILVDAIQTGNRDIGAVYRLEASDLDATRHVSSSHDINLTTALELGKRLGMDLPQEIVIFAIEVRDVTTFSEDCTPEVRKAIPIAADMVIQELSAPPSS